MAPLRTRTDLGISRRIERRQYRAFTIPALMSVTYANAAGRWRWSASGRRHHSPLTEDHQRHAGQVRMHAT
jgi:hypothetical protein